MDFEALYDSINKTNNDTKQEKCCDNLNNYNFKDGVITCSQCNSLISNIIDSPEWRYYGSNDSKNSDPTRCGMPQNPLLPESSIGTSVKGKLNNKVALYQRWNSMPYKEWSKYKVFNDITLKCEKNNLSKKVIDTSKSLYSIISEYKISRGNNRKGIIAACVFNACKECNAPRSIKELAKIFEITPKVLTKGCKNYTEIIRKNKINIDRNQKTDSINLNDFIERFSNKLNLSKNDVKEIIFIANLCHKYLLVYDNTPPSMATGCIYLYIKLKNLPINKKLISENCLISEVTINKCYKKISLHEEFMKDVNLKINKT